MLQVFDNFDTDYEIPGFHIAICYFITSGF
jgi:hypothetical protein